MNTEAIKKSIQKTNSKITQLKNQNEKISAELKKLEEKNKSLVSILKRQEAIDKEYESLNDDRPSYHGDHAVAHKLGKASDKRGSSCYHEL